MLPFLKHTKEASVSVPSPIEKRSPDSESEYDSLESVGQDLLDALHAQDAKGIAAAFRAGFELLDSEPNFEGPHTDKEES